MAQYEITHSILRILLIVFHYVGKYSKYTKLCNIAHDPNNCGKGEK